MNNQCPYVLREYANKKSESRLVSPCIKERHSHGPHEDITGRRWEIADTRERD